jgi:hypothetical protein
LGHWDRLVPDLIADIYGRDPLTAGAAMKDLGAVTEVDLEHPEQSLSWDSETSSIWAVMPAPTCATGREVMRGWDGHRGGQPRVRELRVTGPRSSPAPQLEIRAIASATPAITMTASVVGTSQRRHPVRS